MPRAYPNLDGPCSMGIRREGSKKTKKSTGRSFLLSAAHMNRTLNSLFVVPSSVMLAVRLGALGILVLLAAPAHADEAPAPRGRIFGSDAAPTRATMRLSYNAPSPCPAERELRASLAAHMGYDPIDRDAPQLVRVELARERGAFVARLSREDKRGRVVWSHQHADPDCRRAVEGAVLSIAIAIERAPLRESDVAPSDQASSPLAAPPPPLATAIESKSPSRPSIRIGARGALAMGALPALTAALTVDAGVGWQYASIALEGRVDVPVTGDVDEGRRIHTSLFAGSLVPCGHYKWFVGCGLVTVGALRAEGRDISRPRADTGIFFGAGVRVGVEWAFIERLALRVTGDVLVTLHPMSALQNDREVWRTPPFSGTVGGGLVLRL